MEATLIIADKHEADVDTKEESTSTTVRELSALDLALVGGGAVLSAFM